MDHVPPLKSALFREQVTQRQDGEAVPIRFILRLSSTAIGARLIAM